jgi:hypothetical protein
MEYKLQSAIFYHLFRVSKNFIIVCLFNHPLFLQVGIQHKPDDLYMKTANLVQVDVMKNQVCNDILKIA